MSDPLDLSTLEAVAKAATPGPWCWSYTGTELRAALRLRAEEKLFALRYSLTALADRWGATDSPLPLDRQKVVIDLCALLDPTDGGTDELR